MKKNFRIICGVVAAFVMALSCSKVEEQESVQDPAGEAAGEITISATLSDALTKVAFSPSYGSDGKPESLDLTWEAGDKLRIYNHADKTIYADFELMAGSVGKQTGYFTGNAFDADSYDVEIICGDSEVEYASQTQPADGVTSSLKYFAGASGVADIEELTFTNFSNVLAVTATLPEGVAAVVGSVDITASEPIFYAGKTLTINLAQKGDTGNDGILHLFANLPQENQQIPEGTTLLVHFNAPETDHTVYTRFVELGASAFTAGKLNTINVNASQSDKHAGLATCDGTSAEKAYLIGDKYQMQAMASLMTAGATRYFRMVDDVNLEGVAWTPLNNKSPYDKALDFDGAGHTVSNLVINDATMAFPSFIGNLNGNVSNVTFDSAKINCGDQRAGVLAGSIGLDETTGNCNKVVIQNSEVTTTADMAGAMAALANYIGSISDCHVINTSVTSTKHRVGGMVGSIAKCDLISNCSVENSTIQGTYNVGGLFGTSNEEAVGLVKGCYSTGSVTATLTSGYSRGGGLIGTISAGITMENCYSTCSVTGNGHTNGGLIAQITKAQDIDTDGTSKIDRCYFTGTITVPDGRYSRAGGLIGCIEEITTVEISDCYTSCQMKARRWGGGFIGAVINGTDHKVTNCYTNSYIEFSYASTAGGVFIYEDNSNVTYTGNIALNTSSVLTKFKGTEDTTPTGNYMGTEFSISAKAKEFQWDETIWDLNGSDPVLRWTLKED